MTDAADTFHHTIVDRHDKVLIIDFGSQVTQLIARRVREAGVYCEITPFQLADQAFTSSLRLLFYLAARVLLQMITRPARRRRYLRRAFLCLAYVMASKQWRHSLAVG